MSSSFQFMPLHQLKDRSPEDCWWAKYDLDEHEEQRIEELYAQHQILIPALQERDCDFDYARQIILSGGDIFRLQ
ncbi:hypothetical protein YDYSY3_34460 [Paenibacillus chitinolyticus]|uniref:hypothetical protein n=1 Tax=Paenibacillus chitinolyticus TaxID=79263 RepID=UPI0026E4BC66|nr:hypothetical protein [Paenibacillus chitinolyticus]GKS12446.1 hypothetical protein YDYSY3_34460 [Paenibacillus chitinolyticus]